MSVIHFLQYLVLSITLLLYFTKSCDFINLFITDLNFTLIRYFHAYRPFDCRELSPHIINLSFLNSLQEAHNFYMEMGKGSYVETRIPFIVEPNGYVNKVTGQLLFLNSNTNLAFAPFIKSETLQVMLKFFPGYFFIENIFPYIQREIELLNKLLAEECKIEREREQNLTFINSFDITSIWLCYRACCCNKIKKN